MGCAGCELWMPVHGVRKCYAGNMTQRMTALGPVRGWPKSFGEPEMFPQRMKDAEGWSDLAGTKRLDKPWLDDLPRIVFLNDMGDTFTKGLPKDWLGPFLPRMAKTPHVYLILTKRVGAMRDFFDRHECPPNVGVGASITNEHTKYSRVPLLHEVRASWRFLSVEPMWEFIDLKPFLPWLDWCIFGFESGADPTPGDIHWLRREIKACGEDDVPCFVKQLGARPLSSGRQMMTMKDSHGGDWSEWPSDLRVREMPRAVMPKRREQLAMLI